MDALCPSRLRLVLIIPGWIKTRICTVTIGEEVVVEWLILIYGVNITKEAYERSSEISGNEYFYLS